MLKRLYRRADDNEESVKRRLEIFLDNMDGVVEFIDEIRTEFDGQKPIKELTHEMLTHIKPHAPLYAVQSSLPEIRGADAVREAFTKREEQCEDAVPTEEVMPQLLPSNAVLCSAETQMSCCLPREPVEAASCPRL